MMSKLVMLLVALALAGCQDKEAREEMAKVAPVTASAGVAAAVNPTTASAVLPAVVPATEPKSLATEATPKAASQPAQKIAPSTAQQVVPTKPVATKPAVEAKPAAAAPPVKSEPIVNKSEATPATVKPAVVAEATPAPAKAVAPAAVSSADGLALAKKRNCLACHAVDKKVVGPAWKDVAAKYRGDAGAQARLEAKIAKGGSGVWGGMAMPPQPQVTAEERTTLARFILNLK